ncbi:MAG: histidine kinase dimerization/phospho-acceptor domain-containing protein, partial [Eubacterium aggregans]
MKKRISGSILFTALLTLILTSGLIIPVLYSSFVSETRQALETESGYLLQAMKTLDDVTYLKSVGKDSNTRLTLISPDGTVLYDSNSQMENNGNRPEVEAALDTGKGSDSRLSETLDESTYYYATKLDSGNILRLAITTRSALGVFGSSASLLAFLLVAVMIATLWVGHSISKAILMPINHLDLDHPLENDTYDELSPLLLRLDRQRQWINEQIQALSDKQREFDQITESMGDGLAIFGSNGHVLSLNRSAKAFFEGGIYNGTYLELCRENPFVGLIEIVFQGEKANIRMKRNNRFYELSASPVDAVDGSHAVVLFIADVTERENIEKMRREFSANVSHELKTPLTSILGYSEIMESGLAKPEDINRFAGQIHFEASRLLTLIQDI